MVNLNIIEEDYFKRLFVICFGYVLDFSNSTLQEFIYAIIENEYNSIFRQVDCIGKHGYFRCI